METANTTTTTSGELGALVLASLGIILVTLVVSYAINAVFLGMIFKKAGVETWKAWVPIYNMWVFYELGDQKGFWAPLILVPGVNIASMVFYYIAAYNIGLKLQKDSWFVLLAIFLPVVWLIWLAVDKSTWQGDAVNPVTPAFAGGQPPLPPEPIASAAPQPDPVANESTTPGPVATAATTDLPSVPSTGIESNPATSTPAEAIVEPIPMISPDAPANTVDQGVEEPSVDGILPSADSQPVTPSPQIDEPTPSSDQPPASNQ